MLHNIKQFLQKVGIKGAAMVDIMLNDCHFLVTDTGGFAIQLINKTGAPSIKGTLARTGAIDNSFITTYADDGEAIGVVRQSGVADGQLCWILVYGIAEVLLENGTASTAGYWCRTSSIAPGRAVMNMAIPPGGGVPELCERCCGIGRCIETKAAGTDVYARCVIRFG